jgi:hypothetical protein
MAGDVLDVGVVPVKGVLGHRKSVSLLCIHSAASRKSPEHPAWRGLSAGQSGIRAAIGFNAGTDAGVTGQRPAPRPAPNSRASSPVSRIFAAPASPGKKRRASSESPSRARLSLAIKAVIGAGQEIQLVPEVAVASVGEQVDQQPGNRKVAGHRQAVAEKVPWRATAYPTPGPALQ